jgi:hypothetical protein
MPAASQMPARQDASPDDESGRGLVLVDCLASDWGAYHKDNGKVVWVIVERRCITWEYPGSRDEFI